MELFSNDQSQSSLMDSVYLPDSPSYIHFNMQGRPEGFFGFPSYYQQPESIPPHSCSSSLTETFSSSKVKPEDSLWKIKKRNKANTITTAQHKNKESMNKRTKKTGSEKKEMDEKQAKTDYIHVRARRGQATDSHSLAERVRRERISERMKILQGLVPGCEKVTGKALVLDEIINYVESLKNQVEFLSLKLASVHPILYEFGLNFDDFEYATEDMGSNPQLLSTMLQSSHIQSPEDNFTLMACSSTSLPHGPTPFPQDTSSFFMQVGDHNDSIACVPSSISEKEMRPAN